MGKSASSATRSLPQVRAFMRDHVAQAHVRDQRAGCQGRRGRFAHNLNMLGAAPYKMAVPLTKK